MAYHQAPHEDLPEVVPAQEWPRHQDYRAQGGYSYGQDRRYTPDRMYSQDQSYPEPLYEPVEPYQAPWDQQSYGQEPQTKEPHKAVRSSFPRDVTTRPLPNYKPPPLRWFFLGAIIAVILGYIALTEYAIQTLPNETGRDVILDFSDLERQLDASPSGLAFETTTRPEATGKVRARQETEPTPVAGDVPADVPTDPPTEADPGTPDPGTPDPETPDPGTPELPDNPTPGVPDPDDGETITIYPTVDPGSHVTLDKTITAVVTPIDIPTVIDGKSTTLTSRSTHHLTAPAPDPTFITAHITTLTDADGNPTATTPKTPKPFSTPTEITTTDANGNPTTITTDVLVTPSTTILTDSNGIPTATQTLYPTQPTPTPHVLVFSLKKGDYFAGYFLPTILSVLLTIPIRALDLTAQQYHPVHQLTHARGAPSLLVRTGGFPGLVTTFRSLSAGDFLLPLSSLLVLCSAVLIPLSSEAVSLKLYNVNGACTTKDLKGCVMALSVFGTPARATVALLAFMTVLAVGILVVLKGWVSGVAANPWSAAGVASLCGDERVRALITGLPRTGTVSHEQMAEGLEGRRFRLGYYWKEARVDYGIRMEDEVGAPVLIPQQDVSEDGGRITNRVPFLMLSTTGRALFAAFIVGLLVLILYYNNTGGDTAFERFMSQQTFGVRFLFTSVGVIISFFWASLFDGIAILTPYNHLSKASQPPSTILLTPPTTPLAALPTSLARRDLLLFTTALTALLSDFLPILLTNVPFRLTQTWTAHLVCTWAAVGILSLMLLVVVGTFFEKWPHMPVDPSTLAGAMYYVADSRLVECLEGASLLKGRDRKRWVERVGGWYEFGDVVGVSGGRRVGIDMVDGMGAPG